MARIRKAVVILAQLGLLAGVSFPVPGARNDSGRKLIRTEDLEAWLGDFASDGMEGRAVFSEGLGLAAAYLAVRLREFGVEPAGDQGSYFQRVRVLGVKSTNRSTITVENRGRTRTFKQGEGIRFPANVGGKRTLEADRIEFVGYGLAAPLARHDDFAGRSVKGSVAVWLGAGGPSGLEPDYKRLLDGRARDILDRQGAIAVVGPVLPARRSERGDGPAGEAAQTPGQPAGAPAPQGAPAQPAPGARSGGPPLERADFTTTQRLDGARAPNVSAEEEFFELLFDGQRTGYADLKAKAASGAPLEPFALEGVRLTFNLDADYKVVRTQLTRNVVGIVRGSDPKLRDTYVAFGAHYDHVGYAEGEIVETPEGRRRAGARGRVREGALEDRIWNGADDDGSGSVTILSVAKAFAGGPKPRRSMLFVWHTGEERGLLGSRFFADYPTVPLDRIVAQVNMDMVGRNRDNRPEEANTVYLVGSDRISTELHNLTIAANDALAKPLRLDFEYNDPSDVEGVYYRSDHYSYAAKGIPIVFLSTGLHPDYHANTDSAEKINYEKMTRIAQLSYQLGMRVGNLDHPPARDHRGPRLGRGGGGRLGPE
jgi:hypothetical protein